MRLNAAIERNRSRMDIWLTAARSGVSIAALVTLVSVASIGPAAAQTDIPNFVSKRVPDAGVVGDGTMTWGPWDVYDAQLVAPGGHYDDHHPFALTLSYKRHIDGKLIADTSASEIERQGFADETRLASWHSAMGSIFTDVDDQTTLTGIYIPNKPTCFFRNDKPIGCVNDPLFGKYFFDIWLGSDAREPDLRRSLLGQK